MFYFRLALSLGCTVRDLLARIDSEELSEWMAYYQIEPFGEQRADLRNAINSCVMANAWRGKNSRTFKLSDFIPDFLRKPKAQQTEKEMKALLVRISK